MKKLGKMIGVVTMIMCLIAFVPTMALCQAGAGAGAGTGA